MDIFNGKLTRSKKGGMEMSITTIVILILAITMLGLGLTFVRSMMQKSVGKIGGAIEATQLETQPDAGNPVTIPEQINVKQGQKYQTKLGFYNKYGCDFSNVNVKTFCKKEAAAPETELTMLASPLGTVRAGGIGAANMILNTPTTAKPDETYICTVYVLGTGIGCPAGTPTGASQSDPIEKRAFFMYITP